MKFVKIALVFLTITMFVVACSQTDKDKDKDKDKKATATPKATATVDELASGRQNYKEQCARCHKDDGTGGEVEIDGKKLNADDLTSDKMKKMSDEKYTKYIRDGIPSEGMPAFKDILSEKEINEVIEFVRKDIQK